MCRTRLSSLPIGFCYFAGKGSDLVSSLRLLSFLVVALAIATIVPQASASEPARERLLNGNFENPVLDRGELRPFHRLTGDRSASPGWRMPKHRANVEWVRPRPETGALPPAPEGEQYIIIRELESDEPVIFEQVVEIPSTGSGETGPFELSFQAGRPNGEPMALASALIILLEPESNKAKTSTGSEFIEFVEPGTFARRSLRFNLPTDVRQDRFLVRFVVRGGDRWIGLPNSPGQQRLLIDDVRLQPVYE